ncbi:transmembrane protein 25 isoform X2 [Sphaerodactylus townsendi]|uniref:transmembrane protein 25 isoform X2 n=1 Tax=Sphaerodactylus townsendi TaxID=933632 RepID=UPI00202670F2|nr:transmembrane protein 25 isoform X2 [Sphaerodactylus townsendi]
MQAGGRAVLGGRGLPMPPPPQGPVAAPSGRSGEVCQWPGEAAESRTGRARRSSGPTARPVASLSRARTGSRSLPPSVPAAGGDFGPARARRLARRRVEVMLPPVLLLLFPALLRPGAAEPEAQLISSRPETFTCVAAAPTLAWYLDGEEGSGSGGGAWGVAERRLNCSAVDPATGHESSATVVLHLHVAPEVAQQAAAGSEDGREGGLLMLLVVLLVQARPPAHLTWLAPDGRLAVNASRFVLVDARTFPGLRRHAVQLQLRAWARNFSREGAAVVNASVLPPGFLDTHIELPLLALVVGAAGALAVLGVLGTLLSYLVYQKGKKAAGLTQPAPSPARDSNHLMPQGPRLPRANMSVPINLQLNDLTPEPKASGAEDKEGALSEPEDSLALEDRGRRGKHVPF